MEEIKETFFCKELKAHCSEGEEMETVELGLVIRK